LIDRAIFAYLEDPSLDKNRIKTTKSNGNMYFYEAYVLRVLDDDTDFKADLELEPLDPYRLVIDMGFESLVLLQNTATQV
jgi:hypothetical protein